MPNLQRQQQQQDRTRHPVRHLRGPPDADAKQMEQEAMTPTQRKAMEQALGALEMLTDDYDDGVVGLEIDAIVALRAALAEQPAEQSAEPVGVVEYLMVSNDGWLSKLPPGTKLYTAPPPAKPAERVPLTDEEIAALWLDSISGPLTATKFASAVIAAYERKNGIGEKT